MKNSGLSFDFSTAGRIIFGSGSVHAVPKLVQSLGTRALIVCGVVNREFTRLHDDVRAAGIMSEDFLVSEEPSVEKIHTGVQAAKENDCNIVISFGGGSAIDTGKAIAAMVNNPGDVMDYLEVIGKGKPLTEVSLPHIAIPTTAGTGAEVTRNAVLRSEAHNVKVSLRSAYMIPTMAVVDPELTLSLPPAITASTGMDALTQLIEPFVSSAANPMTDAICKEGIQLSARSLLRAFFNGKDEAARQNLSLASLFGGIALANARLGAVHGFAGPIGGEIAAPHGVICARLLPIVMDVNVRALKSREPGHEVLRKYEVVAQLLTGQEDATSEDGIEWIKNLRDSLQIPGLGVYGLTKADFPKMTDHAANASSMKGNPIRLNTEELFEILDRAL